MPVMGRMSDQDSQVRLMASHCFASLVTLMPLEVGLGVCVCVCVCVVGSGSWREIKVWDL